MYVGASVGRHELALGVWRGSSLAMTRWLKGWKLSAYGFQDSTSAMVRGRQHGSKLHRLRDGQLQLLQPRHRHLRGACLRSADQSARGSLHDLLTVFLDPTHGRGGILHVVNDTGGSSTIGNPDASDRG